MEINVTSEESFVEAMLNADGPVVILFTSPSWCQPCRQFEPHWNKAQEVEALQEYTFIKVDMGEKPEDTGSHWATERFRIMGVPQVKVHKGRSEEIARGFKTRSMAEFEDIKARAIVPLIRELS